MKSLVIKYGGYIILISLLFIFYKEWQKEKQNAIRWEGNYEAAKNDTSEIVYAETLTKKELEQEFNRLANEFNGSSKKITHIHDVVYRDTGSTKFELVYEQVNDTFYPTGEYKYSDSCIQAKISLSKDTLELDYTYTTNITVYGFWERSNSFPKNWRKPLISWGKKRLKAEVKSDCGEIKYNKYIKIKE